MKKDNKNKKIKARCIKTASNGRYNLRTKYTNKNQCTDTKTKANDKKGTVVVTKKTKRIKKNVVATKYCNKIMDQHAKLKKRKIYDIDLSHREIARYNKIRIKVIGFNELIKEILRKNPKAKHLPPFRKKHH